MDIRICLLLAAEAGLALVLLWSAGVLRKPAHVLCAALLLIRKRCRPDSRLPFAPWIVLADAASLLEISLDLLL